MCHHRIIKGTFVIARSGLGPYQPDGDTIRFEADDPRLISSLPRRGEAPENPASINIRFEAIDALEKDQERGAAVAPRDRMFELLGLGQDSLSLGSDGFTVLSAQLSEQRGCILANALDKHGRVIAFVIPEELPQQADGTLIDVVPNDIASTVNRSLLVEGLVYPTFYSTLTATLRDSLTQDAMTARASGYGNGIWNRAVGTPGNPAVIGSSSELADLVLFPTLHRRLVKYLKSHVNFDNFAAWLNTNNENKTVRILANNSITDLIGILHVSGQEIGLLYHPEEFVFIDDPPTVEPVAVGDIVIVGVLGNPIGPAEAGSEVVTLLNRTKSAVRLAGWSLHDNAGQESLTTEVIDAGHTLRIVPKMLYLNNQADRIELRRPDGVVVDQVEWSSGTVEGRTMVFSWPRS